MSANAIQASEQAHGMTARRFMRMDPWLLGAAIGLALCSYVVVKNSGVVAAGTYSEKQALYAAIGLVLSLLVTRFDYSILREYRYFFYGALVILNIVVFATASANGATRWIPLPLFQFQPSEFGKLLLVVTLSAFAVDRSRRVCVRRVVSQIMLLALLPAAIVILQPDLGTGLVYITIAASILFFMGISWKYLAGLATLFVVAIAIVLAVGPALGVSVLHGYQKQRLTTFINPPAVCTSNDQTCYQLHQGEIAIAAGGKTGRGAGATQIKYRYVPEAQDDFIFAVVGARYGFAGAAVVISLYALLIWRSLRILTMSKNLFGTLIAGGLLAMLMFQVFVNIGMTIGIMPVTGVPLPLLSYGGSSVIVTFLAIGLLQSIHVQARMASAGKARVLLV